MSDQSANTDSANLENHQSVSVQTSTIYELANLAVLFPENDCSIFFGGLHTEGKIAINGDIRELGAVLQKYILNKLGDGPYFRIDFSTNIPDWAEENAASRAEELSAATVVREIIVGLTKAERYDPNSESNTMIAHIAVAIEELTRDGVIKIDPQTDVITLAASIVKGMQQSIKTNTDF